MALVEAPLFLIASDFHAETARMEAATRGSTAGITRSDITAIMTVILIFVVIVYECSSPSDFDTVLARLAQLEAEAVDNSQQKCDLHRLILQLESVRREELVAKRRGARRGAASHRWRVSSTRCHAATLPSIAEKAPDDMGAARDSTSKVLIEPVTSYRASPAVTSGTDTGAHSRTPHSQRGECKEANLPSRSGPSSYASEAEHRTLDLSLIHI